MKKINLLILCMASLSAFAQGPLVKTANGTVQGVTEASGVQSFKGIPFALAPVGDLRWKEPQSPKNWDGVRKADHFGPQAMQRKVYADMMFRSDGQGEDCLYLNVWTPAKKATEKLPVLVYFYGGGFTTGDGSEYRYDGESMAKRGIVSITVNYRLGVFGFLAHPELTKESPHQSSGNYGLMDQHAALVWVQKNVAAFGGDPNKVTIAGQSAGSMSVSAQVASPLSKGLIAGAINESGALFGNSSPTPLAKAEESGVSFATKAGAASLADLRKIPADKLLELTGRFGVDVDGYFLPETLQAIFAAGKQMHVPLLEGSNSSEASYTGVIGANTPPTIDAYNAGVKKLYGDRADAVLKVYAPKTDADVIQVAMDLSSDRGIGYTTWKLADMQSKTSGQPVYRYYYIHKRPSSTEFPNPTGAVHSAEIEYAFGNLATNKAYNWTPDDYKLSETMQSYFANFIKTGNPNGKGLLTWNAYQSSSPNVMVMDVNNHAVPSNNQERYLLQDSFSSK